MARGVTHAEYIRAHADGRFYFLEIAARVGGAFIADLVRGCNGRESVARVGADRSGGPAGRTVCAAEVHRGIRGQRPVPGKDRGARTPQSFDAPEIVLRMKKHHHAGLIVRSENPERVRELLEKYSTRVRGAFPGSDAAAGQTDGVRPGDLGPTG